MVKVFFTLGTSINGRLRTGRRCISTLTVLLVLALRRVLNDPDRCQDVVAHRLIFCETAQSMPTEDLTLDCWCCDRFFAYCCACTERRRMAESRYFPTPEDDDKPPPNHVIITRLRSSMAHAWQTVRMEPQLDSGSRLVSTRRYTGPSLSTTRLTLPLPARPNVQSSLPRFMVSAN